MKKIPTVFVRDWAGDRSRVLDEVNPECAWVIAGEGRPTRKMDGTAVLIEGGMAWKRYESKAGKPVPDGFRPAQSPDPETGDQPGWRPVLEGDPADQWLLGAIKSELFWPLPDGTYELIGPKLQGNPEDVPTHRLVLHGAHSLPEPEDGRNYAGLRAFLETHPMEGIVWHHPDGRMCKLKRRDFGLRWPA